jgi:DNA ligase D-like protein (predicted ligase)
MADQLAIELSGGEPHPPATGQSPTARPPLWDGFPTAIRPMQALAAEAPFRSSEYLFEVKWDGLRCLLFIGWDGQVHLQDRGLSDITHLVPELHNVARQVQPGTVLDGELVVTDEHGRPDYLRLRRRLQEGPTGAATAPLGFLAFDVLHLKGRSLMRQPLHRRRARLERAVTPGGHIFVPYHIATEGVELFEACLDRGLEGVMAKHRDSTYVPGQRSPFWLKVKAVKSDDFVVIGSAQRQGRDLFGPLLVAYYELGGLVPCGTVGGGYDDEVAATIAGRLAELRVDDCPLTPPPVMVAPVDWYRPELVICVRYSEWSPDGTLRFPIFNSLRPEVHPTECVRQRPRVVLSGSIRLGPAVHDLTRFPF